jgi:hypothetical protein
MCSAWTERTGIVTVVFRPVMILGDAGLGSISPEDAELGVTLCGPGPFDTSAAADLLGWRATCNWP